MKRGPVSLIEKAGPPFYDVVCEPDAYGWTSRFTGVVVVVVVGAR